MSVPVEWKDLGSIPSDTDSILLERNEQNLVDVNQFARFTRLLHLEFGPRISEELIVELLLSRALPDLVNLVLPYMPTYVPPLPRNLETLILHAYNLRDDLKDNDREDEHEYCRHLHPNCLLRFDRLTLQNAPYGAIKRTKQELEEADLHIDTNPSDSLLELLLSLPPNLNRLSIPCIGYHLNSPLPVEALALLTQLSVLELDIPAGTDWGPMVESLPLLETLWLDLRGETPRNIWIGNPTLRSLTLCNIADCEDVQLALGNMSGLTHLALHNKTWGPRVNDLLEPISAMKSLQSFSFSTLIRHVQTFTLADWIHGLPSSLQQLHFDTIFTNTPLDWRGFNKFNQLTSLHCDRIGHYRWSDFDGLWSPLHQPKMPPTKPCWTCILSSSTSSRH